MATRYYPTLKPPNVVVHGTMAGDWDGGVAVDWFNPVQWTWRLSTSKTAGGVLSSWSAKTNQQGNFDLVFWRYMTYPLDAQTISGTVDCCFQVQATWIDDTDPPSNDSHVTYKIHIYATVGQTTAVRGVLLDNYVDADDWPGTGGAVWTILAAPQTLSSQVIQAGDCVMVEIGARVVSSPTPAATQPPVNWTSMPLRGTGTTASNGTALTDAVDGDTSSAKSPWIEFSDTITEQAPPAAPANDACADAIVIATLPYTSAFIDTTASADTDRGVWWTYTAERDGRIFLSAFGSNYQIFMTAFTGGCGGLSIVSDQHAVYGFMAVHRAESSNTFDVTAGTQYWFRVRNEPPTGTPSASTLNAPDAGGSVRFQAWYREDPADNDLYLPAGNLVAFRDGQPVNLAASFINASPSGIGIDYTRRPMDDLNGGTNTSERLLLALFTSDLVEILQLDTLSYGDGQQEVDYIDDPFATAGANNPAQMHVTAAGQLYQGFWGNGFEYVRGVGSLPALLNTTSDTAAAGYIQSISATDGDNQSGAPFTTTAIAASPQITTPWGLVYDEVMSRVLYTSGGFYIPVGGTQVRLVGGGTVATLVLQSGENPGIKGMCLLPDGGALICNSTKVQRIDSSGTVIQTYTPSIALDSQVLVDVKLHTDFANFTVVDLLTARLFVFNVASGVESATYPTYLQPGTLTQMAIYARGIFPPSPTFTTDIIIPRRQRRAPHLSREQLWNFYSQFQLDLEAGVGLTSGYGSDPQIMLRWSDDGGHTWSNEHWMSGGRRGQYAFRAIERRLGRSRDRVFEVTVSDPVAWNLLAAYLQVDPGTS